MTYDPENIFAKILRGEIPCDKVDEDDHTLSFKDISPKANVHVLVIPKKAYKSFDDFSSSASQEEIIAFFKTVGRVARAHGLSEDGYRLVMNVGKNGCQEVNHFHAHILGGNLLGQKIIPDRAG